MVNLIILSTKTNRLSKHENPDRTAPGISYIFRLRLLGTLLHRKTILRITEITLTVLFRFMSGVIKMVLVS